MVGVGFEADVSDTAHEKVTLSTGQKRELAGITGLVMASTVFFLTPLVLSAPEPALEMAPLERIAVPIALPVVAQEPASAHVQTLALDRKAGLGSGDSGARGAAPRASRVSGVRSAGPLAPARTFATSRAVMTRMTVGGKLTPAARRKGGSNMLMRVLVGSGRYRVQPFPSPTSD